MRLCGRLLVRAFSQSISQLIELISITKGFLLSLRTPIHAREEGFAPDSSRNEVLGYANALFVPDDVKSTIEKSLSICKQSCLDTL